jgi:autophagy-related protein 17
VFEKYSPNPRKDIMASTYDYPETLSAAISSIRESLPSSSDVPSIENILNAQQTTSELMARHLSSLTFHYEQMADALKVSEAGETFSEEDLQGTGTTNCAQCPIPEFLLTLGKI